jgi:hypothetical protein
MIYLIAAMLTVNLQLPVRLYDSVGVPPADLARARISVGAILASAGIEPIWRPCHVLPCIGPVKPHEVVLRLVKSGPASAKESLGFSVIDISHRSGSVATIYLDRVDALAMESAADPGELLGRAIAHEIGHLLIGSTNHPRVGLMRAVWASGELRRRLPSDWVFSDREAAELRRHLVARMQPSAADVFAASTFDFPCPAQ